jgi:hypothetical protein
VIAIGVDPGIAACGFAALDADRKLLLVDVFTSKPDDRIGDTQQRLADMLTWVQGRTERALKIAGGFKPGEDLVVVEWPVIGGRREGEARQSGAKAAAQTFAAAGALIGMLRDFGALFSPVPPTWRAVVAGGRTPTEDVHALLEHDYDIAAKLGRQKARHALDAIGCALYGIKLRTAH